MRAVICAVVLLVSGCGTYVSFPGRSSVEVVDEPGSQAAIDRGAVVNWNGCQPGACTVWLAGHRTSHGAVFSAVTSLKVGDPITYTRHGTVYTYTVVEIEDRCCSGDTFTPWADLMLQTTLRGETVRLVHAMA